MIILLFLNADYIIYFFPVWELTTPQPTPEPLYDYQAATWSLVAIALLLIFVITALGITLWRKVKTDPY